MNDGVCGKNLLESSHTQGIPRTPFLCELRFFLYLENERKYISQRS